MLSLTFKPDDVGYILRTTGGTLVLNQVPTTKHGNGQAFNVEFKLFTTSLVEERGHARNRGE